MANADNRLVVIDDLNHVFSLLNAEKLLSLSQDVTRRVQPTVFVKKEANLEIYLHNTVLLKTLRMLDVHQLVQHCNVLSTILPPDQSPHDWEAFPYMVISHRPTDIARARGIARARR